MVFYTNVILQGPQLISEKNELDFFVTWAATIFVPVGSWKMTFA